MTNTTKIWVLNIVWVLLSLGLVLDVLGNLQQFHQFGIVTNPIKDHVILFCSFTSILLLLIYWLFRRNDKRKFILLSSFFMMLFIGILPEVLLRLTGRYATHTELDGNKSYYSPFGYYQRAGWVFKYEPNTDLGSIKSEFNEYKQSNSLGYIDNEWVADTAVLKIMTLGDSFTEGVGADKAWITELSGLLATECKEDVYTYNGAVSSHDPLLSMMSFKTDLVGFQPDMVFLGLNDSDINDIVARGCKERFGYDENEKQVTFMKEHPEGEYLFAISHTVRGLYRMLGYNELFKAKWETEAEREKATDCIITTLKEFQQLSRDQGFTFIVVIHPLPRDIEAGHMDAFNNVKSELSTMNCKYVDLWPYYTDTLGINTDNMFDYYWPMDRHQKDYKIFAKGVLSQLGCSYFSKADSSIY